MTLNSTATVFEEMSKPFEHIKNMENLIKEETDWLAQHTNEYETKTYQEHMERYESLTNRFEQLEGYQYESKIKQFFTGLILLKVILTNPLMILVVVKNTTFSCSNVIK